MYQHKPHVLHSSVLCSLATYQTVQLRISTDVRPCLPVRMGDRGAGGRGWSQSTSVNLSITGSPHAKTPLSIKTRLNATSKKAPSHTFDQRRWCKHVCLRSRNKQNFHHMTKPVKINDHKNQIDLIKHPVEKSGAIFFFEDKTVNF